jgi:O-antigen ligase
MADPLSIPSERKRGDALMGTMENPLIPAQGEKLKDRLERYLSLTAEYGIYLYVFFLLFDRGEGLRTIGLYGALTGWVILAFFVKRITITLDIIAYSFSLYIISTFLSSFFSIEPVYSLKALRGDVLKSTVTFLIISSFFNTKMLIHLSKIICVSGLIILAFGLHSLLLGRTEFYTSENMFLSLDKNEFGFFVCLFLPFFMMFFLKSDTGLQKGIWALSSIWGILGTMLSASRAAVGNIFAALGIWAIFLLKREHFKKTLMVILIILVFIITTFNFWPERVKNHILLTPVHLKTFTFRTYFFWEPAIEAVKKRPLFGWGYGNKIYRDERPFENTEKPNWALRGGLHSTFISILFQQGIFGLLSYLFLLLSTTFMLFKMALKERDERKLLAIALLSIIVGSFFVNSFLLSIPFKRLAPILGMSSSLLKQRAKYENH